MDEAVLTNEAVLTKLPTVEIKASAGWRAVSVRELWSRRELLLFLTWRNVLIRYKQAVLGISWALLQPLLTMVVFGAVFGGMLKVKTSVPYPVFCFAGVVPWGLFSNAVSGAGTSMVANSMLLTKVYFPRLIVPLSAVLSAVVDFMLALIVLLVLAFFYGVYPSVNWLWLIPLTVLVLIASLAVSLWLAALNVLYRDVQYMIPFILQLGLFISPVAYSANAVHQGWQRIVYGLNPMAGVIQGYRWAVAGGPAPGPWVAVSTAATVVLLVSGIFYFRRMERVFADVV